MSDEKCAIKKSRKRAIESGEIFEIAADAMEPPQWMGQELIDYILNLDTALFRTVSGTFFRWSTAFRARRDVKMSNHLGNEFALSPHELLYRKVGHITVGISQIISCI